MTGELYNTSSPLTPMEAMEGEVLTFIKAGPSLTPTETEEGEGEQQLKASPPLTPTERDEGERGAPKYDEEREVSTMLPISEDKGNEAMDYQDTGTLVETKNLDSTLLMIAQDTGATEHAQNTDDLIMGAPHEIDIFMDGQEVDHAVKIEENSPFLVIKDLTTSPIIVEDNNGSSLNQDTNNLTTTWDTESDALNLQKDAASELIPAQDSTDALVDIPDISASKNIQSDDTSAITHDVNTTPNMSTNMEDDGTLVEVNSQGIHVDDDLNDQKISATSEPANQDIGVSSVSQNEATCISVTSHQSEVYLAKSVVKELRKQQKMAESCKAEARYVEVCTAALVKAAFVASSESVTEGIGESISVENNGMGMENEIEPLAEHNGMATGPPISDDATPPLTSEEQPMKEQHLQEEIDIHAVSAHNVEIYLAESLVRELKMQQKMAESCKAQTRYVEVCTSAMMASKEPVASVKPEKSLMKENDFTGTEMERDVKTECDSLENVTATDLEPTEHVQENITLESNSDELQVVEIPQKLEPIPPPALLVVPKVAVCDASTNTDTTNSCSQSTNTLMPEFNTQGVNTDPPPVAKEIGCNTMLNCFDVLQRAKEMEELQFLKVEHQIAVRQMNEAKSQKMVAEQLTNIVQSDLAELRQQNLTETTRRLQLENELSDTKVGLCSLSPPPPPTLFLLLSLLECNLSLFSPQIELSQTVTQLKEKEERVEELEESLSGTSLLVCQPQKHE